MNIILCGAIDEERLSDLANALDDAEEDGELNILFSSTGGDTTYALAMSDLINMYKDIVYVDITATGEVSSAAVLVLAAGHRRQITKNAYVIVHEGGLGQDFSEDRPTVALEKTKCLVALNERFNKVLAEYTKRPVNYWAAMVEDTWLTADQCLEAGLVDEVV